MTRMPVLRTARLRIRPFTLDDLDSIHRIFDQELRDAELGTTGVYTWAQRQAWLRWTIDSYEQLARLNQPPYGDRAIVLAHTGCLIGAVGYVPCLEPFGLLPSWQVGNTAGSCTSTEFGLFWAIDPAYQRQGYATEAARAMLHYAWETLQLRRVVATTTYDNEASIGVMRKLGMRLETNPSPVPLWLQVVGGIDNPGL